MKRFLNNTSRVPFNQDVYLQPVQWKKRGKQADTYENDEVEIDSSNRTSVEENALNRTLQEFGIPVDSMLSSYYRGFFHEVTESTDFFNDLPFDRSTAQETICLKPSSSATVYLLARKLMSGDLSVKERLVTSALFYVREVVADYDVETLLSMTEEDLFQEGVIALCHAVDLIPKTEAYKDADFPKHYLKRHIKAGINRAISVKDTLVALPEEWYAEMRTINKKVKMATKSMSQEPTLKEVANSLRVTEEALQALADICIPVGNIEEMLEAEEYPLSGSGINQEITPERLQQYKKLHFVIEKLPQDEKKAIRAVYELDGFKRKYLSQLIKYLHLKDGMELKSIVDDAVERLKKEMEQLG